MSIDVMENKKRIRPLSHSSVETRYPENQRQTGFSNFKKIF